MRTRDRLIRTLLSQSLDETPRDDLTARVLRRIRQRRQRPVDAQGGPDTDDDTDDDNDDNDDDNDDDNKPGECSTDPSVTDDRDQPHGGPGHDD